MKRTIQVFEDGKIVKKELKIEDEEHLDCVTKLAVNLAVWFLNVTDWLGRWVLSWAVPALLLGTVIGIPLLCVYCIIRDNFGWLLGG